MTLWLTNQKCINYGSANKGGTGVLLKRWDKIVDLRCPNCGIMNENTAQLNKCTNKDRGLILIKCIKEIKEWMIDNHTYQNSLSGYRNICSGKEKTNF